MGGRGPWCRAFVFFVLGCVFGHWSQRIKKKTYICLVVNSAGTAPLAGGSGIGISASDSGIPQNSVGKTLEKKNGVPVEKVESEFLISEFR